jgi:hypothetical protein
MMHEMLTRTFRNNMWIDCLHLHLSAVIDYELTFQKRFPAFDIQLGWY